MSVAQQFVSFLIDRIDAKLEVLDGASNHETVEEIQLYITELRKAHSELFDELQAPKAARRSAKKDD